MSAGEVGSKYCVYDNPNTQRREYWKDGENYKWISARILLDKNSHVIDEVRHIIFDTGAWKSGHISGNPEAMEVRDENTK